jgi:fused signal recognition particle receptor
MFGFLKKTLQGAINKFSKEVEEEAVTTTEDKEQTTESREHKTQKTEHDKIPATKEHKAKKEPTKKETFHSPQKTNKVKAPAQKIITPLQEKNEEESLEANEEETAQEEITEEISTKEKQEEETKKETIEEEKGFFGKIFSKKKEEETTTVKEEPKKESFFSKLTKITLSEEKFDEFFWDIEVTLLENNVAVEVIEKIKQDLKTTLTGEKVSRKSVEELISESLKKTITEILDVKTIDLIKRSDEKKPLIITMIGVNGSGKTTTLAKLIKYFQKHNKTIVVAAADTFRAAAIQQLEEHTTKLGVKLIKHDYNADPAAVAFDAVKHATAKGIDIVLIDSAGRLHSNDNLMNELKKIIRINKPDINIFVGEAITGNDCVEQATLFNEAVGIDGIILAKADIDEKGGAAISASFVTGKPILFLGTGQGYEDLEVFSAEKVIKSLDL